MKAVIELAERIAREPRSVTTELQAFVASQSFPILEGDTATFFFWDGRPTESVYLIHWLFGLESRQQFRRLGNTDAFYLPLDLPRNSRVEYKLELHRGGNSRWVRDPLNPHQAFDPFGSNSVLPMTGYKEPTWCRPEPGVRGGRLEHFDLQSSVYGDERRVTMYLPVEYRPHKRYPLIVCHDGADYMRYAGMATVLDNLIHRHEVMPVLVAFTSGVRRNEEYAANPLQPRFLVEDLLPAVGERYLLKPGPQNLGLMGASFGGVSTLYTAWTYPGRFGRLLLQSGSFMFTDIGTHQKGPMWDPIVAFVNQFRTDPSRIDARVYMSCGLFESLIYYNRSLVPLMRASGLEVNFVESGDGHNWIGWRDRLREGLTWLFPGHLWMYYE